jgi:HEXXH motif-containing protein
MHRPVTECVTEDDPYRWTYLDRAARGVEPLLGTLAKRLDADSAAELATLLRGYASLDTAGRREVVGAAFFSYWWHQVSRAYAAGDRPALTEVVRHFARYVVMPVARRGIALDRAVTLPLDSGEVALAQASWRYQWPERRTDVLVAVAPEGSITMRSDGHEVVLAAGDGSLPAQRVELPYVPGSGLIADIPSASTRDYLASANATFDRDYGFDDLVAGTFAPAHLDTIAGALGFLERIWPEMRREIDHQVTRLVPFQSQRTGAFTNSAVDGVIFLRAEAAAMVNVLDRLVHECSHLRLNNVFLLHRLHQHDRGEVRHSPFRGMPRPIDGLLHGTFVFVRVAEAMNRAHAATGDDVYRRRRDETLAKVTDALGVVESSVDLTELGREVLRDITEQATRLAAASVG